MQYQSYYFVTLPTLIAAGEGLESATGIEVGSSSEIYIVNKGIGPGNGEVLRVDSIDGVASVPEPSSVLGLLVFGAGGSSAWLKRKRQQHIDQKLVSGAK